ncbi:hypothetical protein BX666DRAFT_1895491 [Dichotomocladium elegans]|nr:hypothetical protein BX666DRAFT_1895491 [Dichotomocladium elegans]
MGQKPSTQRVFGYCISDDKSSKQQQHQQQRHHDRVLSRPEDYGFDLTRNLYSDFASIDATYYANDVDRPATTQRNVHTEQQQQQQKITFADIKRFVDDRKLRFPARALVRLDDDVFYLKMVTKLDLSKNRLTNLPDAFGTLSQLTHLNLSHNRLTALPDSFHGLTELTQLDLSHNATLECNPITPYIGHLKKLSVLDLSHNPSLRELPPELGGLDSLSVLYIHKCPNLWAVPAELLRLPNLRRIKLDKITANQTDCILSHGPPSLVELCARVAVSRHLGSDTTRRWIASHLPRPKPCSGCGEPYLSSYVSRRRLEERIDGTLVMYEYRLCSDHWLANDDDDRKRYMFSALSVPADHDVLKFLPLPSMRPSATLCTHPILQQNDNVVIDDACNKKKWRRWLRPVRLEHQSPSGTSFSSF